MPQAMRERRAAVRRSRRLQELFTRSQRSTESNTVSWDPSLRWSEAVHAAQVLLQGLLAGGCRAVRRREHAIGNIREQKLGDIISDSEVLEDLRDHRQTIKGPCSSCEKADACYGCRGSAYQLTGDYLASDPLCWRNADRQDEIARLPFPADEIIPQRIAHASCRCRRSHGRAVR